MRRFLCSTLLVYGHDVSIDPIDTLWLYIVPKSPISLHSLTQDGIIAAEKLQKTAQKAPVIYSGDA